MSITFHVEAFTHAEADALDSEGAPTLNVHMRGAALLFGVVGIDPEPMGEIDAGDLLARLSATNSARITTYDDLAYVARRLPVLRDAAAAAHRLGRHVVWD